MTIIEFPSFATATALVMAAVAACQDGGSPPATPVPTEATGTVTSGRNETPSVSLVRRADGRIYLGHSVHIDAEAADRDGFVRVVRFYADGAEFGGDDRPPFSATFHPRKPGPVTIAAVATDDDGGSARAEGQYDVVPCPTDTACDEELTLHDIGPPSVTLHWVAPKPRAEHVAPSDITLEVTVDAADQPATVEFFAGTESLGSVQMSPYRVVWRDVAPGRYELVAKVRSAAGFVGTSGVNVVEVSRR